MPGLGQKLVFYCVANLLERTLDGLNPRFSTHRAYFYLLNSILSAGDDGKSIVFERFQLCELCSVFFFSSPAQLVKRRFCFNPSGLCFRDALLGRRKLFNRSLRK